MNHQSPNVTFTLAAPPTPSPRPRHSKALWLVGIGLLVNAAILLTRGQAPDIAFDRTALAQAMPVQPAQPLGARGIYMMPAQLGPMTFGLYLMDVDSGTICVYKALPDNNHFRLMAARSFKYDRFLEDYNNETLTPKEVQKLVETQRQRQDLQSKDDQPTVDQTTRPGDNLPDPPSPDAPK
jgi:hypothetical protein